MTSERITFLTVLHKYLIYAEAFAQYNRLEKEDRIVIESYIEQLKEDWQQELDRVYFFFINQCSHYITSNTRYIVNVSSSK